MSMNTKTLMLLGLGSLATGVSAQSATGLPVASSQFELPGSYLLELQDVAVEGDSRSIVVLLNPPADQGRFSDLGFQGSDTTDVYGRSNTRINDRQSHSPKEDDLNVVPLPPMTFAGFGLLAGLAGARYLRQSRR